MVAPLYESVISTTYFTTEEQCSGLHPTNCLTNHLKDLPNQKPNKPNHLFYIPVKKYRACHYLREETVGKSYGTCIYTVRSRCHALPGHANSTHVLAKPSNPSESPPPQHSPRRIQRTIPQSASHRLCLRDRANPPFHRWLKEQLLHYHVPHPLFDLR